MNPTADPALSIRLRRLVADTRGLEGAALVSVDGLPMVAALPADVQVERLAAMAAAVLSLGERLAEDFGRGGLQQVLIRGENGWVAMVASGSEAVLTALLDETAEEHGALAAVRRAAAELAEYLS